MPEKIQPAAIPLVIVLEIPARSKAMAKMLAALLPKSGVKRACACERSSTTSCDEKKVVAAKIIMALLIAHPTIIENNVSKSSYFKALSMLARSFL